MRAWRPLTSIAPPSGPHCICRRWRHHNIAALLGDRTPKTSTVQVDGFVQSLRKQKKIAFAAIRDGSSIKPLQAVLTPAQAESLSNGAAVRLTGKWQECPPGKEQSHELQVTEAVLLGESDVAADPLQKKHHSSQFLRTIPHLRAKTPHNSLLLRLRSEVIASLTDFFHQADFVQTHTPLITSSDCEGAGEVFKVSTNDAPEKQSPDHFFGSPKYLTVSAQLHLEALSQAVGKVWTLSPTFRAEKSDTPRHLSEFYMLEAEVPFVGDLGSIMDLVEALLRSVGQKLLESRTGGELLESADTRSESDDEHAPSATLRKRWEGLARSDWPRISYEEAIKTLQDASSHDKALFEHSPTYEDGLQAEHERYLAENVGQGSPVFVTHYPQEQKPFYMSPAGDGATVECFDLLVPDLCELVGGSMREYRSEELLTAMKSKGLGDANLDWYVDLRRYGSVPHGGFGLGFDRLLCYLSGTSNIRDIVAFPRWYGRCDA